MRFIKTLDLFIRSCSYKIKRVKYRRDRLRFDWPRVSGPSVPASNESTDSAAKTDDKVDLLLYYFNMKTFKLKNAMLVTYTHTHLHHRLAHEESRIIYKYEK